MRILVMIPTYNEGENIEALIRAILALDVAGLGVLVVDDQSPDGTAAIVARLAAEDSRVVLLSRAGPAGRGLSGRDGFVYALAHGADFLVEMDGDFSHQPKHIPELLRAMSDCDVAVGSRLVPGGSDADRPLFRRWLTLAADAYARRLLRLPIADVNSGFRCYSRRALEAVRPESLKSRGPAIVHETLYRARRAGLRLKEVPIEFVDRKKGASKLGLGRLAAGYLAVLKIALAGD